MDEVKVNRDELIKKLEENRSGHRLMFEEALDGYAHAAREELETQLERLKTGPVFHVLVNLPMPEDHTKDYDAIITMAQMSTTDKLVLSRQEFQQYVMDDWSWRRAWLMSNSGYSQTAASMVQ